MDNTQINQMLLAACTARLACDDDYDQGTKEWHDAVLKADEQMRVAIGHALAAEKEEKERKYWVLVLEHEYGTTIYLCDTVEILDKRLHGHVKEYWKTRMGEDPMPENMDEAVDLYFEDNWEERYEASEEGVIYE